MILDYRSITSAAALLLTTFFLTITLLTIDFGNAYGHSVTLYLIKYYMFFSILNIFFFGATIIFSVINYFVSFYLLIVSIIILAFSLYLIFHNAIVYGHFSSAEKEVKPILINK